ncbi:MAG: ABC transporter ATP-binding protein [Bacilli bacterium]|nr:ABC transporter ATP-binding protein [Bacilli bacterium]
MTNKKILKIENIEKKYIKDKNRINVLNKLSIDFEIGKLYAIVGKSGSGKSTLLKCIAALTSLDKGNIKYLDKEISKLNDKELSKFRNESIGIVFQDFNLLDFLNVYDNILMPLVISGSSLFTNKDNDRVKELIDFVDLNERSNHLPSELSGGEQQRVAIARALVNNPNIILADEPTGNLDRENAKNILELLKKISKDKCVIIVTHDDQVLKYADIIYNLEKGILTKYEPKR